MKTTEDFLAHKNQFIMVRDSPNRYHNKSFMVSNVQPFVHSPPKIENMS